MKGLRVVHNKLHIIIEYRLDQSTIKEKCIVTNQLASPWNDDDEFDETTMNDDEFDILLFNIDDSRGSSCKGE